jgi:molybdenum cofactor biosynthesis protein B
MGGVSARPRSGRAKHAHVARAPRAVRCAVVTVSDSRGPRDDASGDRIHRLIERARHAVVSRAWVKDDPGAIRRALGDALRDRRVDVVITTGGTGVAPRDRTPEALGPRVERWLPGFGERFRALSECQVGGAAWLSRAEAGIVDGRLLVMLPGSTAAVDLALRRLLLPELVHVARILGRFDQEE